MMDRLISALTIFSYKLDWYKECDNVIRLNIDLRNCHIKLLKVIVIGNEENLAAEITWSIHSLVPWEILYVL